MSFVKGRRSRGFFICDTVSSPAALWTCLRRIARVCGAGAGGVGGSGAAGGGWPTNWKCLQKAFSDKGAPN